MDDLLAEFLTETNESMDTLDVELVKFEQNPNDPDILGNIFRLVHTVKGTCGFLGLPRLESVAHASENVLGRIRDGELPVTPAAISLVLQSLDRIKAICAELAATGEEPAGDDSGLIASLNALAHDGEAAAAVAAPEPPAACAGTAGGEAPPPGDDDTAPMPAAGPPVAAPASESETPPVAAPVTESGTPPVAAPASESETPPVAAPVAENGTPPVAAPVAENGTPPAVGTAGPPKPDGNRPAVSHTIRVGVDVLENLMTMVSELVLTRNQLMQLQRSSDDSDVFAAPLQTLNHIVSELQEGVMQTRMQPIGNAWSKLPRIIRDLSLELGKKIELRMHGQDTELDRQILELIRDPLTHMVRNSADHGLETPADRLAAGKSEIGTVTLNAYHEGGHIIIEIRDDGRGINVERVKAKIIANRLATQAELDGMSDSQIQQYIFKAGFSTAEQVTSVSGRGVGMDVVRTNIERIGGTVELQSAQGKGSSFVIKIPLTLAIVSALVVACGGERFAIPQISVLELVRASGGSETRIEDLNGARVLRLRDRLLPLVPLRDMLRLDDGKTGETDRADRAEETASAPDGERRLSGNLPGALDDSFIVVTQVGPASFGIIVDRVFDTEEIVVKPVAPILRDIQIFSGNTILGDGSVIMILDPNGIAAAAGNEMASMDKGESQVVSQPAGDEAEKTAMLLFRAGPGGPKAVPLELIARLEEIEVAAIETSSGGHVVQYRGQIMPLTTLDPAQQPGDKGRQPVLVLVDHGKSIGLMVDEIVDIVEVPLAVEIAGKAPGSLGSAIIAGQTTDVIDAGYHITRIAPDWFRNHGDEPFGGAETPRVLLVDDSPFFRNMIAPLLQIAGYEVAVAESATQALRLCEDGAVFDLIISDIEMPEMNGFDFASKVRAGGRWKDLPIVALSSHTAPADFDRGRQVGFTDYVEKFDRESLLQSLQQALSETRSAA